MKTGSVAGYGPRLYVSDLAKIGRDSIRVVVMAKIIDFTLADQILGVVDAQPVLHEFFKHLLQMIKMLLPSLRVY